MDLMYREEVIGRYSNESLEIIKQTKESRLYFGEESKVPKDILNMFITDRIISQSRKGVDQYLQNIGLLVFNIHRIAEHTRLINPMDGFWLRDNKSETYEGYVIPRLLSLFNNKEDGRVINALSSVGQNQKYFGISKGILGMVKKRLTGLTYDTESEIAVYNLSKLMRIRTCPVYRVDADHSISQYMYNYTIEDITHMRHALSNLDYSKDLFSQIIAQYPDIENDLTRMIILDFVTAQDDRHLSNFALHKGKLYPLYDNGRSLFWDSKESTIKESIEDVALYSTSFGNVGTYYDILLDLAGKGTRFGNLVELNVQKYDIQKSYEEAGYIESRAALISEWTYKCIQELKQLDSIG